MKCFIPISLGTMVSTISVSIIKYSYKFLSNPAQNKTVCHLSDFISFSFLLNNSPLQTKEMFYYIHKMHLKEIFSLRILVYLTIILTQMKL